jgi:DNA-binding NarL/FixJ family response regulator
VQSQDRDGRTTAVIVDEWAVLRSGVGAVLEQYGIDVVGQTADLAAAVRLTARVGVDLVLLGHLAGVGAGIGVRAIRATAPGAKVVVLLQQPNRDEALELLDAGAACVVSRESSEADLREAVMRAARGERHLAPAVLALTSDARSEEEPDVLTERERSVLKELAAGHSNRQIADALFIGEATVKTHLHNIYAKLDVANRVQAIGRARQRGLLAG